MQVLLPVRKGYVPSPPTDDVVMQVKYLVMNRDGSCTSFDNIVGGGHNKIRHYGVPAPGGPEVYQFIDPLSALWLGLVTVEDLGLSQNTLAVLKLAMDDLLP